MSQRKPALSLAATVAALALSPLALAADNPPGSVGKAIGDVEVSRAPSPQAR